MTLEAYRDLVPSVKWYYGQGMDLKNFPDPYDPKWPAARDRVLLKLMVKIYRQMGMGLEWFQRQFLIPPGHEFSRLKFIQLGGAKRVGKTHINAMAILPYCLIPGCEVRLYGPEYENTEREMSRLAYLLFDADKALAKLYPFLHERLMTKQLEPSKGAPQIAWEGGANVLARSMLREKKMVGEPIDLAVICEPGLFPDAKIWTKIIEPNLQDRRGLCRSAGTVDNPWMFDIHQDCSHVSRAEFSKSSYRRVDVEPEPESEMFCVCEVPRWENSFLDIRDDEVRDALAFELPAGQREIAINWLGLWESYTNIAYDRWDPDQHVRYIDDDKWRRLKATPAGWDHFAALDTGGRFNSCGEYVVSPQGMVLMIDEFTTYAYRGGEIEKVVDTGFVPWFEHHVLSDWHEHSQPGTDYRYITYVDPSSHFKPDLQDMGIPWQDARTNDHEAGVNAVNEYLSRGKFCIVKPESSRGRKWCVEYEIPRVMWRVSETGVSGKAMLERGNDHSTDQLRYGLVSRPLAGHYEPPKEETVVQRDIRKAMSTVGSRMDDPQEGMFY